MATESPDHSRQLPADDAHCGSVIRAIALLAPVAVVALLAWIYFRSYDQFMLALDRNSALGPCRGATGVRPLCDFANHYYPQGQALAKGPVVVPGFYYSAFFALCMRGLATFTYPIARAIWGTVVMAATLVLLLAPLTRLLRLTPRACLVYGCIFATSLPLWHDLAFGQVSAITTALVILAFLARDRGHLALPGVLIGLAASIKFYPALFIVYFLVQKEFRAIVVAFTTTIICMGLLPWLSLGDAGLLTFHHLLGTALDQFSSVVASSPFSNFIANAVTHAAFGRVDPTSWLYQGALVLGRLVGCLHVFLLWRSLRIDASRGLRTGLTLGLASIPFLVRSCWVHYFVFLPFLHGSILQDVQPAGRRRIPTVLVRASVAVSAALISFPMLFLVGGGQSYYEGGWPFWATVVLLPGLYMQAFTKA